MTIGDECTAFGLRGGLIKDAPDISGVRTITLDKSDVRKLFNSGTNIVYKTSTGVISTSQTPNFNKVTIAGTPSSDTDAVNVQYVNEKLQGLDVKESVRLATTENDLPVLLSGSFTVNDDHSILNDGNLIVIDGTPLRTGDRVLLQNQPSPKENGIYAANAFGVLERTKDFDAPSEVKGSYVFVSEGEENSTKGFVQTNNTLATIGQDDINFTQFNGAHAFTDGRGLTRVGNTLNVDTSLNFVTEMTGLTNIGTSENTVIVGGNLDVSGDTTFYNAVTGQTNKEYNDDIKNTFATLDWVDWFIKNEGGVWSVDACNNTIIHNTNLNSSVGIGTTNPSDTLDVNGGVNISNNATINGDANIRGELLVEDATINNANVTGVLNVSDRIYINEFNVKENIEAKLDSNATEFGGNAATASAPEVGSALENLLNSKLDSNELNFTGNAATASAAKADSDLESAINGKLASNATEFGGNAATASAAKAGSALESAINGKLASNATEFGGNAATASAAKAGSALESAINGKLDSNELNFTGNAATASAAKADSDLESAINGKLASNATEFGGNAATASAAKAGSALESAINGKLASNATEFGGNAATASAAKAGSALESAINGKLDSNELNFTGNAATASAAKADSDLESAINGKLASNATEFGGNAATASAAKAGSALESALNSKAPLNDPSFSGTLTANSISASSISLTTQITSDVFLSTSQTSVINGENLTITIDAASANKMGTTITLLKGANNYTLNDGNSKTATILGNTSTIIITTGVSAGDIVAYSNGTLVIFST